MSNDEVNGFVFKAVNEGLNNWINTHPKELKTLANKFALAAKGRLAKKRAVEHIRKENGSSLSSLNNISKFTDCNTDNSDEAELFIVEGSSASGTVINGRNNETQAVFSLKGKPINSFEMDYADVVKNKEASDLLSVLKCGFKSNFNIDKLKFGKIIILSDADDDGFHINLLAATLFHEASIDLIRSGKVYAAIPPKYRVSKGVEKPLYFSNDIELDKFYVSEIGKQVEFVSSNKPITSVKTKVNMVSNMRSYVKTLNALAAKYNCTPDIFEQAVIFRFDETLGVDTSGTKLKVTSTKTTFSISGFIRMNGSDEFVSINNVLKKELIKDINEFSESVSTYNFDVEFTNIKKKTKIVDDSYFNVYKRVLNIPEENNYMITRFKGLGECNPDELWSTTLDPATRGLIQLTIDEDGSSTEVVRAFMGKDTAFRKEFLTEVFETLDAEELDV